MFKESFLDQLKHFSKDQEKRKLEKELSELGEFRSETISEIYKCRLEKEKIKSLLSYLDNPKNHEKIFRDGTDITKENIDEKIQKLINNISVLESAEKEIVEIGHLNSDHESAIKHKLKLIETEIDDIYERLALDVTQDFLPNHKNRA